MQGHGAQLSDGLLNGKPNVPHHGRAEKLSLFLQVFLCGLLLAIAVELGMLVSMLKGLKLNDPKSSPIKDLLATGIQDGVTNTFEAADVLGVAAMRNGTWVPAVANSLIHLNFQDVANTILHVEKAIQDVTLSIACGVTGTDTCKADNSIESNDAFAQFIGVVQKFQKEVKSVSPGSLPSGLPTAPNITGWFDFPISMTGGSSYWKALEAPCKALVANLKNEKNGGWAKIPYSESCNPDDTSGPCKGICDRKTMRCQKTMSGWDTETVNQYAEAANKFCEDMAL